MLISAALIGSGVGLGLGAAYMAGGLGETALDHSRAERTVDAEAATGQAQASTLQPGVLRVAKATAQEPLAGRFAVSEKKRGGGYSSELECLTDAVYYEARGETFQGQAAVAQVVMNRVRHPSYPKTVCGVVFQGSYRRTGCQFSFACDGSMHGRREGQAWARARKIAARTLAGVALADVGSATHFHTTGVAPAWGPQMRRVGQVGLHVFYRFNPRRRGNDPIEATPAETMLASMSSSGSGDGPADIRLTSALIEKKPETPEAAPATDSQPPPKAHDAPPAGLTTAEETAPAATQAPATSAS